MKKSIFKRIMALLLAATMALGAFPMAVFAEETEQNTGTIGFLQPVDDVVVEENETPIEEAPVEEELPSEEVAPSEEEILDTESEEVLEEEPAEDNILGEVILENTGSVINEEESIVYSSGSSGIDYDETVDSYYSVISKKDWDLAPGIKESEIVLNNAAGTHRQVAHVVEVDVTNEYAKVMPSYGGMKEALDSKKYGTQVMSQQTAWAEANGYGNIVASMNISLSWYDSEYYKNHPELVGEPLGYLVMDGQYYENSQGKTVGAQTCVVINFDEKDGVARPADMPKVLVRSSSDPITGWEEQVIPANFGWLVKDGKNVYSKDNNSANGASRSFIGVKADGTFVMVMNDGRQAPFSTGFTSYEMGQFMLSLGCVAAVNGDGGGSSTFLSQRPGEEIALHCSPSDGSERPTTHGIFVISTAPATGEFVRATITSENTYFTPGSTVEFKAVGSDLVGTEAEIPENVTWQIKEDGMGTIENGVFVSNGTVGTATAQMVYNGEVVGECSVEIVIPTAFTFQQGTMTVPFGKEVKINLVATVNDGRNEVVLKDGDVSFALDNAALGTINGFTFTSVEEANAPESLTGTLTATLTCANLTATANVILGKGSEVIEDFETDMTWGTGNFRDYPGIEVELKHENAETGKVHSGNGSASFNVNALRSSNVSNGGHNQMGLYLDHSMIIKNAKSIGIWVYLPEDYANFGIYITYFYDPDGDGIYDKRNAGVVLADQPYIYNNVEESGWHYFSTDISAYDSILLNGPDIAHTLIGYNPARGDGMNFRFLEIRSTHTNANNLYQDIGGLNGNFTVYLDDLTVDYSDAVEDREPPKFSDVTLITNNEAEHKMVKRSSVTISQNNLNIVANVAENTEKANATGLNASSAKAYIDGIEVPSTYSNGRIFITDAVVADGMHRVKFEISDNAGNKASVIRLVKVQSGVKASTVKVVPKDATLDRLYGGSVYWMDVKATDIETIQAVTTVIDLNNVNDWELDHMEVAPGFTAEYTIDEVPNTATITITRTGENAQVGEAVLASLPIRVIYFDKDIYDAETMVENGVPYTAETYWKSFPFWCQDVCVDVDYGKITYVDGYTSEVLNVFSNEEFKVDTEMYNVPSEMDAAFIAERGTCHVHTPVALEDKAGSCTENGYTGRTYCEVCDSVVEWGTSINAEGHNYEFDENGVLICTGCGEKFSGVHTDGKTYIEGVVAEGWIGDQYYVDGVLQTGITIIDGVAYDLGNGDKKELYTGYYHDGIGYRYYAGGEMRKGFVTFQDGAYYFDDRTGYAPIGSFELGGRTYKVEGEKGKVLGAWDYSENGIRYYYSLRYYKNTWLEVEGATYYFNNEGYAATGVSILTHMGQYLGAYEFDNEGKLIGPITGVVWSDDGKYMFFAENGILAKDKLVKHGEDYYYARPNYYLITWPTYLTEEQTGGLLPAGEYNFGEDGKLIMINGPVPDTYNPAYLTFYKNGARVYEEGLYEYEGDYYYVRANGLLLTWGMYITKTNGLLPEGEYKFGADGKLQMLNGPIADAYNSAYLNFYKDGIRIYEEGLYEYEGDYYYVRANGLLLTWGMYITKTNGLLPEGEYKFGADGKLQMLNGPMPDAYNSAYLTFYKNGVRVYEEGLYEYESDYYYVRANGLLLTWGMEITKTNGLVEPGYYEFGADGKMIKQ